LTVIKLADYIHFEHIILLFWHFKGYVDRRNDKNDILSRMSRVHSFVDSVTTKKILPGVRIMAAAPPFDHFRKDLAFEAI
jgi:hypothetical protein